MKFQHLTFAAAIIFATASCNSSSNTSDTDSTTTMPADTSSMMSDTTGMSMSGDTSMMHMETCVIMKDNKKQIEVEEMVATLY